MIIKIEWELLERIADYYQFPVAIFLTDIKVFKNKTRNEALQQKAELYDKIEAIIKEQLESNKK